MTGPKRNDPIDGLGTDEMDEFPDADDAGDGDGAQPAVEMPEVKPALIHVPYVRG